jgi:hypothetical protein
VILGGRARTTINKTVPGRRCHLRVINSRDRFRNPMNTGRAHEEAYRPLLTPFGTGESEWISPRLDLINRRFC